MEKGPGPEEVSRASRREELKEHQPASLGRGGSWKSTSQPPNAASLITSSQELEAGSPWMQSTQHPQCEGTAWWEEGRGGPGIKRAAPTPVSLPHLMLRKEPALGLRFSTPSILGPGSLYPTCPLRQMAQADSLVWKWMTFSC